MKASLLVAILCLGSPVVLFTQIIDSFDDGNLNQPAWFGDTDHFIINDLQQLQLNAPEAGSSFIYLGYDVPENLEINWFVKMDFAPSSSNQTKIYFGLDTPQTDIASGYFIQIGESGSEDNWELYELSQGIETLLVEGPPGKFANDPAQAFIRVVVNHDQIKIAAKENENNPYVYSDDVTIPTLKPAKSYFGILCKYTSTRTDKFFYDDVYIGPIIPDTTAPEVVNIEVFSDSLILHFSEPIVTAQLSLEQFEVNKGIGTPTAIGIINSQDIILYYSSSFIPNTKYNLKIRSIRDFSENELGMATIEFEHVEFFLPQTGEIVISEFLADPTPSQGLPESEFVELFNTSINPFNLADLIIIVNDREAELPEFILRPDQYVILCDPDDIDLFTPFGNTVGVNKLPIIRNEEGTIAIKTAQNQYLHHATYNSKTLKDPAKRNGGWSFEIINPALYCETSVNWTSSINHDGGTPGRLNSVFDIDFLGEPMRLNQFLASDSIIEFELSQNIFEPPPSSVLREIFSIKGVIIDSITFFPPLYSKGMINIDLQRNTIYNLSFQPSFISCALSTKDIQMNFGVAESTQRGDLIINEILFNPRNDGADFIEISNISDKTLNIQNLMIFNRQNKDVSDPIEYNFGMLPKTLLCLTTNTENIKQEYNVENPQWLHSCDLPSLPNDSGSPVLFFDGTDTILIDGMMYDEDMQHPLLSNPDGVSLERIEEMGNSLDPDNWYSASSTSGFATPTGHNSQGFKSESSESSDYFVLADQIVAPNDNDDRNMLIINYQLNKPGYICTVEIYNMFGRKINSIYEQALLGIGGKLLWDGRDENNTIVPIGRYIVLIDAFHPQGETIRQKLSCVVANYF